MASDQQDVAVATPRDARCAVGDVEGRGWTWILARMFVSGMASETIANIEFVCF